MFVVFLLLSSFESSQFQEKHGVQWQSPRSSCLPYTSKKLPSLASFRVYLYNSVRNASLDYLKHKDVEGNYLQKMLDSHSTTFRMEEEEEGFFSEEVYRQLLQTIDALPDRCREVFLMYMEGKKNEEIATALHVSLETVKTQKKRAMSFLRKKLGFI